MSHVYYHIYYHAVWGTKNRIDLIDDRINEIIKEAVNVKSKELKGQVMEFNSYLDHCHALLTIPSKISVSEFLGQLKGFSSFEINRLSLEEGIEWQRGFGVLTLSDKGLPFIKRYIKNQNNHHQNNELVDILEYIPEPKTKEKLRVKDEDAPGVIAPS